jgi:hypothetical protein
MIYVLMSRSVIVKNMGEANAKMLPETREQRTEEYRKLLSQAEERKELAEFVGKHVRDRYFEMKAKISIAERKDREAEELRTYLREHGVNWEPDFFGCSPWLAKQDIGRALGIIDDSQLDKLLERMARVATNTREELARLRESMSPIQQKRVG